MKTKIFHIRFQNYLPNFFISILILMGFFSNAQKIVANDTISSRKIKMTTLAFGGTGVLFTKVNNQFAAMTGGRGSATFNNRYTFGGGGWGMPKGVEIESSKKDTLEYFKFGYGGLEFGYIFFEGQKFRLGANILTAGGMGFQETIPKAKGEVKMFPVFEPSVYAQIALGKLLKADIGINYRIVTCSNLSFINNRQLSICNEITCLFK